MKLRDKSKILKYIKTELLKIKEKEIITTHELANFILETNYIPTPAYHKSQEGKTRTRF